jgi:hypothetical protein
MISRKEGFPGERIVVLPPVLVEITVLKAADSMSLTASGMSQSKSQSVS